MSGQTRRSAPAAPAGNHQPVINDWQFVPALSRDSVGANLCVRPLCSTHKQSIDIHEGHGHDDGAVTVGQARLEENRPL